MRDDAEPTEHLSTKRIRGAYFHGQENEHATRW
jgi:hypothetical protein